MNIEYGAVEKFSGYSSVGNYRITLPPNPWDPRPYNKFRLRVLRRSKLVYEAIGLSTVWDVINHLKSLVGDPLLPRPNFGDWSFNEIGRIANISGSVILPFLANFLQNTLPADTPPGPSFSVHAGSA